jgi:hypothetical protein
LSWFFPFRNVAGFHSRCRPPGLVAAPPSVRSALPKSPGMLNLLYIAIGSSFFFFGNPDSGVLHLVCTCQNHLLLPASCMLARSMAVLALSAPLSALPGSPNTQYTRWRTTVSSGRTMRMVGISVLYRLGTYTPTTKYKYHLNLSNPLLTACFRKILLSVCALPLPFDWWPGIS